MLSIAETPVSILILVLNIGASLYAFSAPGLIEKWAFRPRRILEHGEYSRFFTAGFVHVNGAHLAFNMITFFFFGPQIERVLGPAAFLVLYFGSDLAAQGLSFMLNRDDPHYSAVGASGAVSGVVFAFCLFAPFQMLYLFFALPIPAIVFAVGYVVGSIYALRGAKERRRAGQRGGIAHEAHLGGAVGGVMLTIVLEPRSLEAFLGAFQNLF